MCNDNLVRLQVQPYAALKESLNSKVFRQTKLPNWTGPLSQLTTSDASAREVCCVSFVISGRITFTYTDINSRPLELRSSLPYRCLRWRHVATQKDGVSYQIPEFSTFHSVLKKALCCLPSCSCAFLQLPREHPNCFISLRAAYHPEAVLSYWVNRFDTFRCLLFSPFHCII